MQALPKHVWAMVTKLIPQKLMIAVDRDEWKFYPPRPLFHPFSSFICKRWGRGCCWNGDGWIGGCRGSGAG
jgi:hypothetical protein